MRSGPLGERQYGSVPGQQPTCAPGDRQVDEYLVVTVTADQPHCWRRIDVNHEAVLPEASLDACVIRLIAGGNAAPEYMLEFAQHGWMADPADPSGLDLLDQCRDGRIVKDEPVHDNLGIDHDGGDDRRQE